MRIKEERNFEQAVNMASGVDPDDVARIKDLGPLAFVDGASSSGVLQIGGVGFTPEGGVATRLINKTGAASVKGSLVSADAAVAGAFKLQANEYDALGVVYETGVADGSPCWVVHYGQADVLLEDGTASAMGNWCHHAATDGRADCSLTQPSGAGFTEASEHFKEIGHCLQTVTAGTNKLARILLHFL